MGDTLSALERVAKVGRVVDAAHTSPSLQKKHHEYAFVEVLPKGGFIYDDVSEWASTTKGVVSYALGALEKIRGTQSMPEHFYLTEEKMLRSMLVCWRDKGLGALVQQEDAIRDNAEQADALRPRFRKLGRKYASRIAAMPDHELGMLYHEARVPINKGKGAPLWLPSDDKELTVALIKCGADAGDYAELERKFKQLAGTPIGFKISLYLRIQQSSKAVPSWEYYPGGAAVVPAGERMGPKRRKVQALPFILNYHYVSYANVLRHVMATDPNHSNTGTVTYAQQAVRHYKYSAALDLSNYDDTVSWQTLDAYCQDVTLPVTDQLVSRGLMSRASQHLLLSIDHHLNRMDMICPSPFDGEAHRIVPKVGGIVSGKRTTSQEGSDINRERFAFKAEWAGLSDYAFFNSSDDMVIATNDKKGLEKYGTLESQLGFTETTSPETTYLMTRLTKDGPSGYRYLGRMLLRTINQEEMTEHTTLLGYAASIATRYSLLQGHPLQSVFYPALKAGRNPRLTAAVAQAEAYGTQALVLAYARSLVTDMSHHVKDRINKLIQLVEDAGLSSSTELAPTLAALAARSYVSKSELERMAADLPLHHAQRLIVRNKFNAGR